MNNCNCCSCQDFKARSGTRLSLSQSLQIRELIEREMSVVTARGDVCGRIVHPMNNPDFVENLLTKHNFPWSELSYMFRKRYNDNMDYFLTCQRSQNIK